MFSALLRDVPADRAPLISLVSGLAVARAIGDDARLKWPNDVRIGGKKCCGIIGELANGYLVVGIGVNVHHAAGELPDDLDATSLAIAHGNAPRRDDLCASILRELNGIAEDARWLTEYRERCETIGATVRVELADETFEGVASEVKEDGTLIVDGRAVVAGDVVHVR